MLCAVHGCGYPTFCASARSLSGICFDMFATAGMGVSDEGMYGPLGGGFAFRRLDSTSTSAWESRRVGVQVGNDRECDHEENCERLEVSHDDEEADPVAAAQHLRRNGFIRVPRSRKAVDGEIAAEVCGTGGLQSLERFGACLGEIVLRGVGNWVCEEEVHPPKVHPHV